MERPGCETLYYWHSLISYSPTHTDSDKMDDLSRAKHGGDVGAIGGGGGAKGDSSPSLSSTHSKKEQLPFFSGIPSVEVVKGLLHLYKPKLVSQSQKLLIPS